MARGNKRHSARKNDNQHSHFIPGKSIRQNVFHYLNKNPLLKPKDLCKLLELDYKYYKDYVTHLRFEWKNDYQRQHGLKRLRFHKWHGWLYVPEGVDRASAVDVGWIRTRARNRYFMWKDKNGRLEWFETNRVKVLVSKPATLGKALQLLANAFFRTALIFDIRVFTRFAKKLKFKGATATLDVGQRLPYERIDFLKESNGIVVTLGDRSHPTSIEIDFHLPRWGERMEQALESFLKVMEKTTELKKPKPIRPKPMRPGEDYAV